MEPQQYDFGYSNSEMPKAGGSSHTNHDYNESYVDYIEHLVSDVTLANQNIKGGRVNHLPRTIL